MSEIWESLQDSPSTKWITSSVDYTFLQWLPDYYITDTGYATWYENSVDTSQGFSSFSDEQQKVVYFYLENQSSSKISGDYASNIDYRVSFGDVIDINFNEETQTAGSVGGITFVNAVLDEAIGGRAFFPTEYAISGEFTNRGDIIVNTNDSSNQNLNLGEGGCWTILHELGHAFGGLNDVHETSLSGTEYDSQKYTMMSYNTHGGVYTSGLGLLDIAALQDTYGTTNNTTRSGDTVYSLGQGLGYNGATPDSAFLYTIWDGGGEDTIDVSGFTVSAEIDLREGRFSSIGKDGYGNQWEMDTESYDGGNVAIAYGTVIENVTGTAHDDRFIGNDTANILNGGLGKDTVDYSQDEAQGGTAGITATLDSNGDGTAIDGFGNTDTFLGIENLILTESDDTITLDTPSGRRIDAGGGDDDTVTYTTNVVEDHNSGAPGEVIIWDQRAKESDTLIGVEKLTHTATIVLPDHDEDVALGTRTVDHQIITNDYSSYEGDLTITASLRSSFDGRYGNVYIAEASRNSQISVTLDDGSIHTASIGSSAMDVAPDYSYIDWNGMYRDMGYYEAVQHSISIVGSNNGDSVYVDHGYYEIDARFTPHPVIFASGSGDDDITIAEGTSGFVLGFCGGNDEVNGAAGINSIEMWEGLRESEVTITESADKVVFDAGAFGSLTLNGISVAPTITWLSDHTSEVNGTWGADSLVARAGETYNGLGGNDYIMGEGNNTITGGAGDDVVLTGLGTNVVYGNSGNDILLFASGGAHSDTFYGGEGIDRAVLMGDFSDYLYSGGVFTHLGQGSTYALHDVEEVQFDDGIFDFETEIHTVSVVDTDVAVNDAFDVPMFSDEFSLDVLSNDSSLIEAIFAYQQPLHGTIVLNDEKTGFSYTPDTSYEGSDSFSYSVVNDLGHVETSTVDIDVLLTGPHLGTNDDDVIVGTSGSDYMRGLDGNDTLESGGGDGDVMYGGLGWDSYILDPTTTNAIIQDIAVGYEGEFVGSLGRVYLNNATITFNNLLSNASINGNDLVVSDGINTVVTIKDADTFGSIILDDGTYVSSSSLYWYAFDPSWGWSGETHQPTDGNDNIQYPMDILAIDLLGGDDTFNGSGIVFGGEGNDTLGGGNGDDAYFGEAGDDTLNEYYGNDILNGGEGRDTLWIGYADEGVDIDLSQNKIFNDGLGYTGEIYSIEDVNGTWMNDTIIGSDSMDETIRTRDGNDILSGGAGSYDYLYGGSGNDTYLFNLGDGEDYINDYSGDLDVIKFGVGIDQSNVILTQGGNSLFITFDNSDDLLVVYNHYSTSPIEKLVFFNGSEVLLTGEQITITGTSLSDTLIGTDGADYIDAGDGDDVLDGGAGDDTLLGGTGSDVYHYTSGIDTITDSSGVDKIIFDPSWDISQVVVSGNELYFDATNKIIFKNNSDENDISVVERFEFDGYGAMSLQDVVLHSSKAGLITIDAADISSHGDVYLQDVTPDNFEVLDNGDTLHLWGNTWKSMDFFYEVTEGTVLEFDFRSTSEGEIHGIGLGSDLTVDAATDPNFELFGTDNWLANRIDDYDVGDGWKHYTINVGDYYTGDINYLTFINDHDVADPTADSYFRDIQVYEAPGLITIDAADISSHGDVYLQDVTPDNFEVLDNGDTLHLWGNTWKSMDFFYEVTEGTVLEFDFRSTSEGEIHGIGLGSDLTVDAATDPNFELFGTDNWLANRIDDYDVGDGWRHYTINVGDYYTGDVNYLTFINDHDVADPTADSYFRDIQVYDDGVKGTSGGDDLHGSSTENVLYGYGGNDILHGYGSTDAMYGGAGSDYLYGGSGDDVLYGGDGVDMLYGQGGADTFVFKAGSAFIASDNIQDFNLSEGDKLDISDILSGYDPLADAITDFVQITENGSNSYLSVDADGGADNFVQIAYLYGATGLTDEEALETSGNLIAA